MVFHITQSISRNKTQIGLESDTLLNIPKHFFKRFLKTYTIVLFKEISYTVYLEVSELTLISLNIMMSDDKIVHFRCN